MPTISKESKAGHNVSRSTVASDIIARMALIDDNAIMQDASGLPQTFVCPKETIACKVALTDGVPCAVDISLKPLKRGDKERILLLLEVEVLHEGDLFVVGVKSTKKQIAAILNELETNSNLVVPVKFTRSAEKFDNEGNKVALDNPAGYWRFYGKNLVKVENVSTTTNTTQTQSNPAAEQVI